jgi:hypothetical protein
MNFLRNVLSSVWWDKWDNYDEKEQFDWQSNYDEFRPNILTCFGVTKLTRITAKWAFLNVLSSFRWDLWWTRRKNWKELTVCRRLTIFLTLSKIGDWQISCFTGTEFLLESLNRILKTLYCTSVFHLHHSVRLFVSFCWGLYSTKTTIGCLTINKK